MVSPPSPRTRLPPPSGRQLGETHQLSRPTLSARSRAAGSPRHPSWVALLHPGPWHGAGTKGREASGGDGVHYPAVMLSQRVFTHQNGRLSTFSTCSPTTPPKAETQERAGNHVSIRAGSSTQGDREQLLDNGGANKPHW